MRTGQVFLGLINDRPLVLGRTPMGLSMCTEEVPDAMLSAYLAKDDAGFPRMLREWLDGPTKLWLVAGDDGSLFAVASGPEGGRKVDPDELGAVPEINDLILHLVTLARQQIPAWRDDDATAPLDAYVDTQWMYVGAEANGDA